MKKSLIVLAVLAASSAAMAQSSVTLFGVVDAAVTYGSGDGGNKTQLTSGGHTASRLGFRGVEDLGGGLKAGFHLEAALNVDSGSGGNSNPNNQVVQNSNGGLTFNRRSTLSLLGNFGEVRLGRDYTPQFWNTASFDPFGYNGVGAIVNSQVTLAGPTAVRASNSVAYHAPTNLGGIYGSVAFHLGENPSNAGPNNDGSQKKDGNGAGFRIGYANGPIDAALAYSETKFAAGNIKTFNLGGSYDFGVAKLLAVYNQDKNDGVTNGVANPDGNSFLIGGLIPVGQGQVRLAYSTYKHEKVNVSDPKFSKFALGYVHNLSKRTALYATYAHLSTKHGGLASLGGAAFDPKKASQNSNGYDIGIKHSF